MPVQGISSKEQLSILDLGSPSARNSGSSNSEKRRRERRGVNPRSTATRDRVLSVFCCLMILTCCILCLGSSRAYAEYENNEASVSKLGSFSTFPYLKRLSQERVQPGVLHLYVSPRDARIRLDGKLIEYPEQDETESSPFLKFENLIPGTHILRVTKSGHSAGLKYVSIEPGSTTALKVKIRNRWRFLASEIFTLGLLTATGVGIAILMSS